MMPSEESQHPNTDLKDEEHSIKLTLDEANVSKKSGFDEDPLKALVIKSPIRIQHPEAPAESAFSSEKRPRSIHAELLGIH